jgi:NAD-dependent dihydropyrimidine dehydrogenase PreA subunit
MFGHHFHHFHSSGADGGFRKVEDKSGKCVLCGKCQKSCPTGALMVDPQNHALLYNRSRCIKCGLCIAECPTGALSRHSHAKIM